jgi:hypothetical protein
MRLGVYEVTARTPGTTLGPSRNPSPLGAGGMGEVRGAAMLGLVACVPSLHRPSA